MLGFVILGNQLFATHLIKKISPDAVFMSEDYELCTYYKFHKHKLIFFLSSMRHYANELKDKKINITYHQLDKLGQNTNYETRLESWIKKNKIMSIKMYEIEDKFFEARLVKKFKDLKINFEFIHSPMFLCSRLEFSEYIKGTKKPFMKTFYERQRKHQKILIDKNGRPVGGQFSFDEDNRLKLPKNISIPISPSYLVDQIDKDVVQLVDQLFPNHPGDSALFWLPTSRLHAQKWLEHFIDFKLREFGPYEDAIDKSNKQLFHSLLSAFMNIGFLTPAEIIDFVIDRYKEDKLPLNSVEGFIRQVIGWREFIRGIYQNYSDQQETTNFWNHKRKMKKCWYTGSTGLPPLDDSIQYVAKYGYTHHIERLMILANTMNLSEIKPQIVHQWFMELFVDSSDWVMGPNVYGMGLFSDGGIFATKPYICGSNYWLKMSDYKKGDWCDIIDGLYWRFIEKHKIFYSRNPRMKMMVNTIEKMDISRKKSIYKAAENWLDKVTC